MEAASRRALISVSDKTGIVDFARALAALGFELISTGGTARLLAENGIAVTAVEDHTGFPEMLAGRVKTLHPRIHAGLLARPGEDDATLAAHGIPRIDLAVIDLYPFESVTARPDCTLQEAIEQIDIGGPAMVRSAAKNHAAVGVVTRPEQYPLVLQRLQQGAGRLDEAFRFELAVAAFNRIAQYDAAISNYLSSVAGDGSRAAFPRQFNAGFEKITDLRYGENPHQQAAWYREPGAAGGLGGAELLQGKELSFNNVADADSAWACARNFSVPACVIVKHANPCGVALGAGPLEAYRKAWETDPTSAFGGIIAFNRSVDAETAQAIVGQQFAEVIIAPAFSDGARQAFAAKPNVRVLLPGPGEAAPQLDLRRVTGGLLLQTGDDAQITREQCRVVTRRQPTEPEWEDLLFAWQVVRAVKSNAIVMVSGGRTLGIGAGQMSRVDATRIACWKAGEAGLSLSGGRMASDAFFPFRDGVDSAAQAGMAAVIQPGGSMRDEEVIAAADEHGIAMVFTGIRHFRH